MNKPQKIVHFDKVSDLYKSLGMEIEQGAEFTIHNLRDIHDSASYKSPVFRANYYSFVFIKNGEGNYTTDNHNFEFQSRTIYFTNPGHLKAFEFYRLAEGHLITLSESFLKQNVHQDIFNEFPFLLAETVPPQALSIEEFADFEGLYQQIMTEYRDNSPYKFRIIGNLFVVILLKVKEKFWKDYTPIDEGNRSSQIVKLFKQQLEQHYIELAQGKQESLFQVQDYASAQNLNTSYFNQVIKSKTGKSVSSWIAEKTTAQAKALLKHSPKSIKEISYTLGFAELAHFSNFFKKQSGVAPSTYRKKYGE